MNKRLIFSLIFVVLMLLPFVVRGETIIYDNITTSNCKNLKMFVDYSNIKYINEYDYDVYIDGYFLDSYKIDDNICINDNTEIVININSKINTDINTNQFDNIKYQIPIISGLILSVLLISIVIIFLYRSWKK